MTEKNAIQVYLCPHCQGGIEIEAVNCGIFRHAEDITTKEQNPHASEAEIQGKSIRGCGKPFRVVVKQDGTYELVICDWNT
jgi:hypothetical protein